MRESHRKADNRLDSVMNVLVIVLALGMLWLGTGEVDAPPATISASWQA